ncbi:MAG TPA: amidohydrolase [Polyangiaceae bacterium]|nr:amidohydrolase [Polyangiaceae bacterium]
MSLPLRALPAIALILCTCMPQGRRPSASVPQNREPPPAPAASPFAEGEARARTGVEIIESPHGPPVLLRHATVMTAAGRRYDQGFVLMSNGVIAGVGDGEGPDPTAAGGIVVEARGKFVTPGIIDPHSHIGVYPVPDTSAHDDGNELTDPVSAGLRAEHSFWPQDPAIERAVAGGVTTVAVLPGSGNLVGGRGIVMHLLPRRGARAMRFPGAPDLLKMACGENPKRVYGALKRAPTTRMGNVRALREAFLKARRYARDWDEWTAKQRQPPPKERTASGSKEKDSDSKPPDRDLALETLALVLRGEILVEWHCYQADDMLAALQVADEFGFQVRAFHHALEAYKIRDVLTRESVAIATWDDWWGFKMEAYDGIPENAALMTEAGGRAALHSDSAVAIQILNQAAGKAMSAGLAAGVKLTEDDALRWITANPAWVLGIDGQVGTLETGKRADVVVWSDDPFGTYAVAEQVYIDGHLVFDRAHPAAPFSDFELGLRAMPPLGGGPPPLQAPSPDGGAR